MSQADFESCVKILKGLGRPIVVKMVPNEDGLGPSTALLYIAEGLAKICKEHDIEIIFIVQIESGADFNEAQYIGLQVKYCNTIQEVRVVRRNNVIKLVKKNEQVLAIETAERLLDYPWLAEEYYRNEKFEVKDGKIDAYICMITPVAHRAPQEAGAAVIEVVDHNWPLSLEKIFADDKREHPEDWRTRRVRDIIGAEERFRDKKWPNTWRDELLDDVVHREILPKINEDDTLVHRVLMFPEPIAPGEFYCKWCSLLPGKVTRLDGVLGGWKNESRERVRTESRQKLAELWFQNPSYLNDKKIILVQGGGTPTWDRTLARMLAQCLLTEGLKDRLFLFTLRSVQRLFNPKECDPQIVKDWNWESFDKVKEKVSQSSTVRLISQELPKFQMYYVVADFSFSRPGGITINDNIAARIPDACVAEPGHWQTEKIRNHCELHRVLRSVNFSAFQAGGIGIVLDQFEGQHKSNSRMIEIMNTIPNEQEVVAARQILEVLANNIQERGISTT